MPKTRTMTDDQIKKMAHGDYIEARQCGHYPDWLSDGINSEDDLADWADEYGLTPEQFEKYMNYFMELCV